MFIIIHTLRNGSLLILAKTLFNMYKFLWEVTEILLFNYYDVHSCPKLSLQPVLSFSSFEHKNMKLRENFYYEMIN